MPTNVVTLLKSKGPIFGSVVASLVLGFAIGVTRSANSGAKLAEARYQNNFVSVKEYNRVCDQCERIAQLYFADKKRISQLIIRCEKTQDQLQTVLKNRIRRPPLTQLDGNQ